MTVADLRRQLVHARGEVAQLKAATHSSLDHEGRVQVEATPIWADERERAEMIFSEALNRVSGLQNEVQFARQEIERLRSQASSTSREAVPAADQEVTDLKRELAEARGYVTTLTRDLGHSHQEIQGLHKQGAAAEQATKRAREREAALTRDLRAARRGLQRANERLQIAAQPDG